MSQRHTREHLQNSITAIRSSKNLCDMFPDCRMPDHASSSEHVYAAISDELTLNGRAQRSLATFCQTQFDAEVRQLMDECIDMNVIGNDEYSQIAEIEARCVRMLADLWNSPDPKQSAGCSTIGSSEAAMLGGLSMKWRWRQRMQKRGFATDKPNLICGPAQVCWHKFARYFDVEIREVAMERDSLLLSPEEVLRRLDVNTIGVISTLGVTMTLAYEPIAAICEALDDYQKTSGIDVPVHVDAASGGFIAPFIHPDIIWDFRLPRVKSINASGHKSGLCPPGIGWILWREKQDLPEDLVFRVNYLGGEIRTLALNFSRPIGQIVAQYYNLLRLGKEGYRKIHQTCSETAAFFSHELHKMGPFEILNAGRDGIPGVCWKGKPEMRDFTLYDLSNRLSTRGWRVPTYTLPPNLSDVVVMRIVVRHGVSRALISSLLKEIRAALDFFAVQGIAQPLSSE